MTADQLEEYWDELTPKQRANEIDNGLVSMMWSIDFSRTEKRLIVFMRLVVKLVREQQQAAVSSPACSTCNDTHRMQLGDREVPCTRCPTPCPECANHGGRGAYCSQSPCACECHEQDAAREAARRKR